MKLLFFTERWFDTGNASFIWFTVYVSMSLVWLHDHAEICLINAWRTLWMWWTGARIFRVDKMVMIGRLQKKKNVKLLISLIYF